MHERCILFWFLQLSYVNIILCAILFKKKKIESFPYISAPPHAIFGIHEAIYINFRGKLSLKTNEDL